MQSQKAKGFISIFLAAFFFGLLAFLVKVAVATMPAAQILFVRSVLTLLFIFAILFAILFLNEAFTFHFVIGAALVFGGGLYLIAREEGWLPFLK
ncbi:MAG: hypothetical protein U9R38_05560 [Candidatus Margulisiibacteriota bacterium]|nr:hypothetical protein [Candidatus Margulisiibacteriota bacterium]